MSDQEGWYVGGIDIGASLELRNDFGVPHYHLFGRLLCAKGLRYDNGIEDKLIAARAVCAILKCGAKPVTWNNEPFWFIGEDCLNASPLVLAGAETATSAEAGNLASNFARLAGAAGLIGGVACVVGLPPT